MGITITYEDGNYELVIDGLEIWVGTKAECEARAIELRTFTENKG